jgi:hypothetical protein
MTHIINIKRIIVELEKRSDDPLAPVILHLLRAYPDLEWLDNATTLIGGLSDLAQRAMEPDEPLALPQPLILALRARLEAMLKALTEYRPDGAKP